MRGRRGISAGGKGHNVARQLCLWGVPTVSVVPRSGRGWRQAAKIDRTRIREIALRSGGRTGWALVEGSGQRLDFFTEDPSWNLQDWSRWSHFFLQNTRENDWLVVAGSVPAGARPGWWRKLFVRLKQQGIRIVVDGRGPLLLEALKAGVEWIKGNLQEIEETVKARGPVACLAQIDRLSRGQGRVLMTLGSRGLLVKTGDVKIALPAPKIKIQDATGSGDAVTAAWLYGILRGWEISKTAGFAVWAGSENAAGRNDVVARLKRPRGFA